MTRVSDTTSYYERQKERTARIYLCNRFYMQAKTVAKPHTNFGIFDLNRMKAALNTKRTKVPKSLNREEKRNFLSEK